jgi:hypothetical protein
MQRKTALGSIARTKLRSIARNKLRTIARTKLRSSGRTKLRSIARTKLRNIDPPSCNLFIRQIQTLCVVTFIGFKLLTRFGLQRIAGEV